jgi:hypothetical protein
MNVSFSAVPAVVLFILYGFSTNAQIPTSSPVDAGSLSAFHALVEADSPPFSLYSLLSQSGAIAKILRQTSNVDRPPDTYLLFDGARQHQSYCLAVQQTNLETTEITQGVVLCALMIDDNIAEHYTLNVEYRKTGTSDWKKAERITSLFSAKGRMILPLSDEGFPNIPYYVAGVEFYRVEPPCEVRTEAEALPGESLPRKYVGLGVGGGFILQDRIELHFRGDTVSTTTYNGKEISWNGLLNVNVFPGRDAFRRYSPVFWSRDFYREFYRRWSFQAGIAFTRSNQLLQHYTLGVGFRLLGFLDITGTALFSSRTSENTVSVVSPADHVRADQVLPQTRKQYFLFGININFLEF